MEKSDLNRQVLFPLPRLGSWNEEERRTRRGLEDKEALKALFTNIIGHAAGSSTSVRKTISLEEDDKKLVNQTTNKNKNTNNPRVVSKNCCAGAGVGAGACQQAQVRNYQSAYPTNWVSPRTHSASKTQLRLSACEHNTLLPGNPINRQSRPSPAPGPRRPELSWSTRSPSVKPWVVTSLKVISLASSSLSEASII
ncbi:hypothetical protein WN944_020438 [Citrus x changshan-huyou]|uniref:Uncharacterized protein n=1 Tax=Citrus x changshan-huyou TaxID=2935761 RepID=A0AAP0QGU1_9ROSI